MSVALTEAELEVIRRRLAEVAPYVRPGDMPRMLATIDALQAKIDMYEAALIDKFGADVLERFADGNWKRPLGSW